RSGGDAARHRTNGARRTARRTWLRSMGTSRPWARNGSIGLLSIPPDLEDVYPRHGEIARAMLGVRHPATARRGISFFGMRGSGLATMMLALAMAAPGAVAVCDNPFIDATPLTVLGRNRYQGYQGGLYPQGSNARPASHDLAYDRTSRLVLLDTDGVPDAENGVFVLISIGNSNATQEFSDF